jgi:hypothetical protein
MQFHRSFPVDETRVSAARVRYHSQYPTFAAGRSPLNFSACVHANSEGVTMKGFPPRLFQAATFSGFLIVFCCLLMSMAGCSGSNVTRGGPTPTPTPGNAFVYTANAGGNSISGFANDGTGALTPVPGSPFTVPGEPFGIAATPNHQFLYATSFQNNQISSFSILEALAASPSTQLQDA